MNALKFKNFLSTVSAIVASSLLLISCEKQAITNGSNDEVVDQIKTTGAIEDDPLISGSIPMIVSSDFLLNKKNTGGPIERLAAKSRRDNTLPAVSFSTPGNGATVTGAINVIVNATDNVGVNTVSLKIDGILLSSKTSSPYTFTWNSATVTNGSHTLTATAADATGNSSSASMQVTVNNVTAGDITKPSVSITSPANGSSVTGTINVGVAASDNVGVSSVKFSVDGSQLASKSSAPYNFSWNSSSVANGVHTLTATAFDAAGNSGLISIQVTVNTTVLPPAPIPSSYQLVMPAVKNQGTEGSCVSFATIYARSAEQYYKTGASAYNDAANVFSPEFIFNQVNMNGTCTSSSLVPSLDLLKNKGVCSWQAMPYSTYNGCALMPNATQNNEAANYKITSYSTIIAQDQTAIKTMIAGKHPVIITLTIDQQFYDATPGFIWKSYTNNSGYHALTICGYDDSKHAYKAINSWGTSWGDAGYIWIDYDFLVTVSSYYAYAIKL
jgi:C1A family cysteine protease